MLKLLTALLLCVGVANAADTPIGVAYRSFEGGLNNDDASVSIAANESPSLLNVQIDEPAGALTQRNGYQTCGTIPSGNTITNLYEYSKNDGTRSLIATDNTTVWSTADCVNYSTITTGLNSLDLPRFATVLDNLWIVNGSTWPIVWNGTTASRLDGAGGRPTGPIAKYISYWKSRVWLGTTPTAPSSVYFSALVDDLGNILDPATSTAAWTATNQIYINRDDGSPVYGMKPYRDNLYVFKETGISRIVFESEYDLSVAKNVSTIGSKFNDAIVEMDDGFLRFVGRDGIYAFDGSTVKRLSSKITPTFETLKQPTRGEETRIWDTADNFIAGTLTNTSTQYLDGSVSLDFDVSSRVYDTFTDESKWTFGGGQDYFSVVSGSYRYSFGGGSSKTGYVYTSTKTSNWGEYSFGLNIGAYSNTGLSVSAPNEVWYYFSSDGNDIATLNGYCINVSIKNSWSQKIDLVKVTGGVHSVIASSSSPVAYASYPGGSPIYSAGFYYASYIPITIDFSISGVISVRKNGVEIISATDSTFNKGYSSYNLFRVSGFGYYNFGGYTLTDAGIDNIYIPGYFTSSGTYYSQISTFTNLTQWRAFGIDEELNGQTINYSVRTGTSVYNVGVASWTPITSGAIISTSSDTYAQWKADFATTANSVTPLLNTASMGFATGDASVSVIRGINYRSRYWMSGSTSPLNNYNDLTIVESKSPLNTYTLYDLPLTAMAMWSGNLYGAIGNTGKIARLDYGSTDDGAAINSYWNSRDEVYENPIFYKTINTGILDYSNTPANTGLVVSLSPDEGATWQNRTINLSASTLSRNTKKLNYNANTSLGFRTKVSNNVLGVGFKIYGIHNFGTQTGFYGK